MQLATQNSSLKTQNSASPSPWLILALVGIPVFIGALDVTIISAILPEVLIQFQLPIESSLDDLAWAVSGYLLAYTISMTFMGRVSDLIGRRKVYLICLAIFILGSVWVAAASDLPAQVIEGLLRRLGQRPDPAEVAMSSLVIGRLIQAFGGGALVPISMALVGDLFPPHRRAQPLGLIGAIDTAGWVVGHLYGGVMVQFVDWRTLFWLNVPVGLAAFGITWFVLRKVQQPRAPGRFDLTGAVLLGLALAAMSIGLGANTEVTADVTTFEQFSALPPYAAPLLLSAAVALILFVVVERRREYPLIDLKLFRRRNFTSGNLVSLAVGFALMIGLIGPPILINIRAEDLDHLTEAALPVGLVMSALTIPMALAAIPGGWLSDRFGHRAPTMAGLALASIGFVLAGLTWFETITYPEMAVHMLLVGTGLGLTFSPTSAAVLNAAPDDQRGIASAIDDMLRLMGMTLASAALTTIALRRVSTLAVSMIGQEVAMTQEAVNMYVTITAQVIRELALFGALLCLLALIPAGLLRGGRAKDFAEDHPQAESASAAGRARIEEPGVK